MAYDVARDCVVTFGGVWFERTFPARNLADTWERSGGGGAAGPWTARFPRTLPSARERHALVYDAPRQQIVLFGGQNQSRKSAETWVWDGTDWSMHSGGPAPARRGQHAMAADPLSGRVVLFGGLDGASLELGDTWEWDGSGWTERFPATRPPPSADDAMAFDVARGRLVLVGPEIAPGRMGAWEWSGNDWVARQPLVAPPERKEFSLSTHPGGGVLLFGGIASSGTPLNDAWLWDGRDWTLVWAGTGTGPTPRGSHAATYDAGRGVVIVYGGADGGVMPLNDAWEWDGAQWQQVPGPLPAQPLVGEFDEQRGHTVALRLDETWIFEAGRWTQRFPSTSLPAPVRLGSITYDVGRGQIQVLRYDSTAGRTPVLWTWDGTTWRQRSSRGALADRFGEAMAHDVARGRTVLFGGFGAGFVARNDTLEWTGTAWRERPVTAPPARGGHALAYDRGRRTMMMFGGATSGLGALLNDTWEFDGNVWRRRFPGTVPPARQDHVMTYDVARGVVVMTGGRGSAPGSNFSDTWEWDGTNWAQRTAPAGWLGFPGALFYDHGAQRVLALDNEAMWYYEPESPASVVPFGRGCAGTFGPPVLSGIGPLPWTGGSLALQIESAPIGRLAVLVFGGSTVTWAGIPLPLPLASLRMPGCTLWTGAEITQPTVVAPFLLEIPESPALVGGQIFGQALVFDPPANPLGLIWSNGLALTIGGR